MGSQRNPNSSTESALATVAKNLIVARSTAGLTQSALAEAAGVSRATIIQIESGEADPRLSTLAEVAAALGISPMMLLLGEAELKAIWSIHKETQKLEPARRPSSEDVEKMEKLLQTGLQKNMLRAAELGASTFANGLTLPKLSGGTIAGAAIGSVLFPGLGTIVGATIGAAFQKIKEDKK